MFIITFVIFLYTFGILTCINKSFPHPHWAYASLLVLFALGTEIVWFLSAKVNWLCAWNFILCLW
jgi:hypothetical protein